jgi:galactokinase
MDQMACSVGSLISIDFEDTKNPVVQKVEFDLSTHGYHLVVTNTGGSHADLTPDYASIPKEMREVASYFGKNVLREVDEDAFKSNILDVRKSVSDRAILRAKHFFGENTRVKKQITAISNGDIKSFLDMVIASGDSSYKLLQNIYSSKDEQGVAIGLSIAEEILKGKGAWRIHGGGFAGTILAIVPDELLEKYVEEMDNVFGKGSAAILNIRNCGAIEITI